MLGRASRELVGDSPLVLEGIGILVDLVNALNDEVDPDLPIQKALTLEVILDDLMEERRKVNSRRLVGYMVIQTQDFRDTMCLLDAINIPEDVKDLLEAQLCQGETYELPHAL